jgi:cytoskeleton protein RodZ
MRVTERDAMARPDARETQSERAGSLLRVARESAGMSIDAVASHLKLAPRQVKALEDGDYSHLPGRTFVRGFVRNYARLVHLDAERVLGALPGGTAAPTLEAPTLHPTAQTMGELPTTDHSRTPWSRWAIPLVLAAIVAAAAIYEWMRPAGEAPAVAQKDVAPAPVTPAPSAPAAAPPAQSAGGTPLPNPLASGAPGSESAPAANANPASTAPPAAASATPAARAGATDTAPASAPSAGEQTVIVAFRKSSWTEIRDRDGRLLLTGTHPAGTTQTLSGAPPLAVTIGNAGDVTLRYKGEPIDLAPFTQKNVARLRLQ